MKSMINYTLTDEALVVENIDTLVLSLGQQAYNPLESALCDSGLEPLVIGDCLLPRTAEEAVYEGMIIGENAKSVPSPSGVQ